MKLLKLRMSRLSLAVVVAALGLATVTSGDDSASGNAKLLVSKRVRPEF